MTKYNFFAIAAISSIINIGASVNAAAVAPGWDLLYTEKAKLTNPSGDPDPLFLVPVSFGTYDFGALGVHDVGNADTIIRRLDRVVGPFGSTDIEVVALQLKTDGPVSLFGSPALQFYFTESLSFESLGTMDITFLSDDHGTFSSWFDITIDVWLNDFNDRLVGRFEKRFHLLDQPWSRLPPEGAIRILGVNEFLNGFDRSEDFWIGPGAMHISPDNSMHVVRPAFVPEPATWAMLVAGFGLVGSALRRQKAAAPSET